MCEPCCPDKQQQGADHLAEIEWGCLGMCEVEGGQEGGCERPVGVDQPGSVLHKALCDPRVSMAELRHAYQDSFAAELLQ